MPVEELVTAVQVRGRSVSQVAANSVSQIANSNLLLQAGLSCETPVVSCSSHGCAGVLQMAQ